MISATGIAGLMSIPTARCLLPNTSSCTLQLTFSPVERWLYNLWSAINSLNRGPLGQDLETGPRSITILPVCWFSAPKRSVSSDPFQRDVGGNQLDRIPATQPHLSLLLFEIHLKLLTQKLTHSFRQISQRIVALVKFLVKLVYRDCLVSIGLMLCKLRARALSKRNECQPNAQALRPNFRYAKKRTKPSTLRNAKTRANTFDNALVVAVVALNFSKETSLFYFRVGPFSVHTLVYPDSAEPVLYYTAVIRERTPLR